MLKKLIYFIFIINLSAFSVSPQETNSFLPITIESSETEYDYYRNMIIVKVKDGSVSKEHILNLVSEADEKIEVIRVFRPYSFLDTDKDIRGLTRVYKIFYDGNIDPLKLSKRITSSESVEYAEPVFVHDNAVIPNDSLYSDQEALKIIQTERCWDITRGSQDVIIAIVDSEIDWWHDDLMSNIYQNPGETGIDDNGVEKKYNGIDDDKNGFIDDYRGWDFMSNTTYAELLAGNIKEDNNTRINDKDSRQFHGTLVAGVASAVTDNSIGVASVGWNCNILPVKVRSDLGIGGREHDGVLYAAMLEADVINCSWMGVGYSNLERDIIIQATEMGSLIIASAGNSGQSIDLQNYDNSQYVMYVGASDKSDSVLDYSDFGVLTSVFAPGKDIICCLPFDRYTVSSGTSLSAPMVSGLAGLVKSLHPDWNNYQIWHQIRSCSDNVLTDEDSERYKYYGRLNSYRSLKINQSFNEGERIPGIRYIDYTINTSSGKIDTYENVQLKLSLINFLASAEDLQVSFTSMEDLITINDKIIIEQLGNMQEKIVEIDLRLSDKAKWHHEEAYLLIKYNSNEYEDYQLLRLEIDPPPQKRFFAKGRVIDSLEIEKNEAKLQIKKLHSPDLNTCWGVGVTEDYKPFYFISDTNTIIKKGFFAETATGTPIEIFALDGKTAFAFLFIAGESNTIWKTTDSGEKWEKIKLDKYVDYVPIIRFYDRKNGIALANFTSESRKYILNTNDGGYSWQVSEINIDREDDIIPVVFFDGIRSVFATDSNHLLYMDHRGDYLHKNASNLGEFSFSELIFSPERQAAILTKETKEGDIDAFFAYSNDQGGLWTIKENIALNEMLKISDPENFFAMPNSGKYIVFAESDKMVVTDDLGENWYPVDNELRDEYIMQKEEVSSFVHNGRMGRLWIADISGKISYLSLDDLFIPPDSSKKNEIAYHICYPNPSRSDLFIQYYTSSSGKVSLSIYDVYGKNYIDKMQYISKYDYGKFYVNTSLLADGIYFYSLEAGDGIATGKFVVIKRGY